MASCRFRSTAPSSKALWYPRWGRGFSSRSVSAWSAALSAAATVAVAVFVAITLLPAVLGAVGTKVFGARIPVVKAPDPEDEKPTMGLTWVWKDNKWKLSNTSACEVAGYAQVPCAL